ncbi:MULTISPECIES: hypothetical protein [unclassified Streptomyces]|uniref:hypothetical protein n=1 Tax=unclassified Streptomyces TaxID=2593676 RepID=UPI00369FD754
MLGTRVTSEWRLRSGHERSAAPARLLDLDHRLPLTDENAAGPGEPLRCTVGLTAQGERKALPIASPKVWYATDGTDWKPASAAPVAPTDAGRSPGRLSGPPRSICGPPSRTPRVRR